MLNINLLFVVIVVVFKNNFLVIFLKLMGNFEYFVEKVEVFYSKLK